MKTIRIIILSSLLTMSTLALADTTVRPTRTYEALVQTVRLPARPTGTISVRECDDCDYETYRVTARTLYVVDNKSMRLDDFRKVVDRLRLGGDYPVNVTRDIQTNTITRVFVFTQ